ncbi:MAG: di-trans,poly-cis-decaprenylcistransferase [Thermoprotei archaeon]|nr:MAG: di-trans,poly-cis-decaprenylcistransferase [Thermoprotei archaeon]
MLRRGVDIAFKIATLPGVNRLARALLSLVYKLYEEWLWRQIRDGPIPQHVAIIPDGNRRWARRRGLMTSDGHVHGYERLKEVLKWLLELGVRAITVYAMSNENCLYRPPEERIRLFKLIKRGLRELLEDRDGIISRYKVRVKVFGRLELVPSEVSELARMLEDKTRLYSDRFLNIALCYGGRQEIVDAVRRVALDVKNGLLSPEEIDEEVFSKYLYTAHMSEIADPDLVIRTSGEFRISNFLLWQSAYSEFYFCDVYWPDFRRIDLWRAIRSYQKRERRFGR